jgi:hypothetical protein
MSRARSQPHIAAAALLLLASFCLFWFPDTIADPDLWGHIRFGQDILRSGHIIQTDSYSYRTAGRAWINHEWLSEVIFAGVYDRVGPPGLIELKLLVSLTIIVLGYIHLIRRGLGSFSAVVLLILVSIPFRMGLGTVRPQMFTYLFFVVELLLIERAARGRAAWLSVLPILFASWVNLHGGVLAGVGVLGLWLSARVIETITAKTSPFTSRLGALGHLILLCGACGLALLLNPYRAGLIGFLVRTATVPRPEITEWTPLKLMSGPGLLDLILLVISVVAMLSSCRPRKTTAAFILGATAVLPFVSNRHYPLFALALVVLGGEHIADTWNRWRSRLPARFDLRRPMAIACVLLSALLILRAPLRLGCIRVEPFYFTFPARAVALLKQSGLRANAAVPFEWGEYVLWHLAPDVKVSIDGRRETVYSDEIYRQSLDFQRGTGRWDALLRNAPTDLVLTPIESPTAHLLGRTDGWLALYRDTCCMIFVRVGFTGLNLILQSPVPALADNGAGLCFPIESSQRGELTH